MFFFYYCLISLHEIFSYLYGFVAYIVHVLLLFLNKVNSTCSHDLFHCCPAF